MEIQHSVVLYYTFERVHYYWFTQQHTGIVDVLGYGILISRGTAGGLGPLVSMLFLTMSRNTLTRLRETWLYNYSVFIEIDFQSQLL